MAELETTLGRYMTAREVPHPSRGAVTRCWGIYSTRGATLGVVTWYSRWRRYAFRAAPDAVFDPDCLREIAEFVEDRTREHRAARVQA